MSEKIDEIQVRKVAKLSRLDLTDSEIKEFTGQLEAILEYVDKMNQLDTEGVEPLAHCLPITNCLREDKAEDSLGADATLGPLQTPNAFRVDLCIEDAIHTDDGLAALMILGRLGSQLGLPHAFLIELPRTDTATISPF